MYLLHLLKDATFELEFYFEHKQMPARVFPMSNFWFSFLQLITAQSCLLEGQSVLLTAGVIHFYTLISVCIGMYMHILDAGDF